MKRRRFLVASVGTAPLLTGCYTAPTSTASRTETTRTTATSALTKPGTVDNHRTTAVEALSHEAVRRSTDDGHDWVLRVTLRLEPQNTETATAYPIGVFLVFFDADGRVLYREHRQVPANTGSTPRTVTLSTVFRPSEAATDTFGSYRIDLVHA